MTELQQTIIRINELVYQENYFGGAKPYKEVTLEMLLVASCKIKELLFIKHYINDETIVIKNYSKNYTFVWQLNKTLTQQDKKDQQIIINIFK